MPSRSRTSSPTCRRLSRSSARPARAGRLRGTSAGYIEQWARSCRSAPASRPGLARRHLGVARVSVVRPAVGVVLAKGAAGGRLRSCPPRRASPAAPPLLRYGGHLPPLAFHRRGQQTARSNAATRSRRRRGAGVEVARTHDGCGTKSGCRENSTRQNVSERHRIGDRPSHDGPRAPENVAERDVGELFNRIDQSWPLNGCWAIVNVAIARTRRRPGRPGRCGVRRMATTTARPS